MIDFNFVSESLRSNTFHSEILWKLQIGALAPHILDSKLIILELIPILSPCCPMQILLILNICKNNNHSEMQMYIICYLSHIFTSI